MITPLRSWSLKTKFALCSGVLMGVFSIVFTTWTLHNGESDVHASVVDAQLALVRSTAADIDAKVDEAIAEKLKNAPRDQGGDQLAAGFLKIITAEIGGA